MILENGTRLHQAAGSGNMIMASTGPMRNRDNHMTSERLAVVVVAVNLYRNVMIDAQNQAQQLRANMKVLPPRTHARTHFTFW